MDAEMTAPGAFHPYNGFQNDVYVNVNATPSGATMNSFPDPFLYVAGDRLPLPGTAMELAPGVKWVRMPLPFALDHINLWLLRDSIEGEQGPVGGWTVVDCCIASAEARALWENIFARELEGLPVLRVVATHMHPDHIGLADWLCERWNARLWVSATDYYSALVASQGSSAFSSEMAADFYLAHGLNDPAFLAHVRLRGSYYTSLVPSLPRQFRRLLDGDVLRIGGHAWRCMGGYGHAPEHMALHCSELGVLVSGDMVLPRISTNVSVYASEPEADPLKLFLASLERMRSLPEDTLVLPSHGKPFRGLHARIEQLQAHHAKHLATVMAACGKGPQSARDILPLLFERPLDAHQTTFAIGEALAHLHALWHEGMLRRQRSSDGVYRFSVHP